MERLFSNKVELKTDPEHFGELTQSQSILDQPELLRARMEKEGYLFFRGLLGRDEVLAARREILLKYAIIGELDATRPIDDAIHSRSDAIEKVNLRAFSQSLRDGLAYRRIIDHPKLLKVYEGLLEGEVRSFDFRWPRFVRPGEGCGIHCDGPYMNRGTERVFSSWIPLGDVAKHEGALMILEKRDEHERLLQRYLAKDADRDKIEWLSTNPVVLQEKFSGRWLSADFQAGDVLCFTMQTVHGALDNMSPINKCRLSSDSRYQRTDEVFDERWNGSDPEAHGYDKVFFPGLGQWRNRDFKDEWKPVDEHGRLRLDEEPQ
ncbi:phytanoyl-CoA dioxygenase family protein [Stieleria varia]|uniref:1-deoxypentalenic acid 11-beta-hydroxylase n=1 Tax=Stieleria varia TaxID=2528005 RepID=A0A5C6AZP9_9BACT|nr:phytanoyl-CoA dioxygenase family protein [Stieleria varia]TWU04997.1 1-deoxypentalenic acid 11-beta-hydroxylase [Stieleria varia]